MEEEQFNSSHRASTSITSLIEFKKDIQFLSFENEQARKVYLSQSFLAQCLPPFLTPIIGREQEVGAIRAFLQQSEVRLLTLTGPGGVGKTRLALQVATEVSSMFADGTCFVSLAHIHSIDLVLPTIAQALGLNERKNHSLLTQVQAVIRDKQFLLLLDGFERVVESALQLKKLLAVCPHLKILITSRTVLRLLEEQEFCVAPLALPNLAHLPPHKNLSQVASVSLFLQRIRTTHPDFELTSDNAYAVAQICIHLDGLPLALELAATRMKIFSPQCLLARLGHRLSLLTLGTRDAPERQQTLRKTMEWSYYLLTQEEQDHFCRLAVFVGGFSLQAIESIVNAAVKQSEPLLDIITSLIDQSLLQREPQVSNEEQRFIMLGTIREYALECLHNSDEEEVIRQAHAAYYLEQTKIIALKVMGEEPPLWIEWIEHEFENIRVAFDWFVSSRDAEGALGVCGALCAFWSQNPTSEGYSWVRQALECYQHSVTNVQTETKAQAMQTAAMLGYYRSNWTQADVLAEESLQIFRSAGNTQGMAKVLLIQGMGALLRDQYTVANAVADECMRILQGTEYTLLFSEALLVLAYSFYFQGDHRQAYMLVKKGFTPGQQTTGELYAMMSTIHAQALFAKTQGNDADVQSMYEEGIAITKATIEIGVLLPIVQCLVSLGAIVALQKRYTWAVQLWGKAKALYKTRDECCKLGPQEWLFTILSTHLLYAQVVETVHTHLGEQTFTDVWNEGEAMILEQLLVSPASQVPTTSSPPVKVSVTYADGLTPRERDVLRLLAEGLSSAMIAERLVISLATVNTHVRTIYSKLGVSSRSAATRYAIEHHLT